MLAGKNYLGLRTPSACRLNRDSENNQNDVGKSGATADDIALLSTEFDQIEYVGQGGMGVVYKALDRRLHTLVAIKLLNAETDQLAARRFQKEAQALAELRHPNIIQILRFSAVGARLMLVMEYFPGQDLGTKISQGKLSRNECVLIFRQICAAVAHAHDRGIIHRDLKPSNILISTADGGIEAKVVDFGVASRIDAKEQRLTRTGVLVGTPSYMSPEQCAGEPVTAATDIYSLGCVLYECLSGKRPFEGDSALDVMYKQMHADLDCPPEISAGDFNVIAQAMSVNPDERFDTAIELAAAFESSVTTRKSASLRRITAPQAKPKLPRRKAVVILAAMVGVLAVAGTFLAWQAFSSAQRPPELPPDPDLIMDLDRYSLEKLIGLMDEKLKAGAHPPKRLEDEIYKRAQLSGMPATHLLIAAAWEHGAEACPAQRDLYFRQAKNSYRDAIALFHQQGTQCSFEPTRLAVLDLPQYRTIPSVDIEDGLETLNNEIEFADKLADNRLYQIKTRLDLLAFYMLANRPDEAAKYRAELRKKYSDRELRDEAVRSEKYQADCLLQKIFPKHPNFPF